MSGGGTLIIYGLIGLVVSPAMRLRAVVPVGWPTLVAYAVFWPFFAPFLFAPRVAPTADSNGPIAQARQELQIAVGELPKRTQTLLQDEVARVLALTDGMQTLERGIIDMDAVLATPSFDQSTTQATLEALLARGCGEDDPRVQSVRARLDNIAQLHRLRDRRAADLEQALLTLQALTSEVRLLACAFVGRDETPLAIAQVSALVRALAEGLFAPDEALI
jgi:hypothetical protein